MAAELRILRNWWKWLLAVAFLGCASALAIALASGILHTGQPRGASAEGRQVAPPATIFSNQRLKVWWEMPAPVTARLSPSGSESNIHPADYTGPSSCKECHPRNFESWSVHSHRWMNALANEKTVKGDFTGSAGISYLGGRATFNHEDGKYWMKLERGGRKRVYEITQTIGSRFFQYDVGKQAEGPEPLAHPFYHKEDLRQFGYWLDKKEWAPIVHVGAEEPDGKRPDPFAPPDTGRHFAEYSASCNFCHTTFAMADMFGRDPQHVGTHAPVSMQFSLKQYLDKERPNTAAGVLEKMATSPDQGLMADWSASKYGVTLGVSCEACHLGGKEHVQSEGRVPPRFIPESPYLFLDGEKTSATGRTHDNV